MEADRGRTAQVDRLTRGLADRRLLPDVEAALLIRRHTAAEPRRLRAWLAAHADHPRAQAVDRIARAMPSRVIGDLPRIATAPSALTGHGDEDMPWRDATPRPLSRADEVLARQVRAAIRLGDAAVALRWIAGDRDADPLFRAVLRAETGYQFLVQGDAREARAVAASAMAFADRVPLAGWVVGLAQWRLGQPANAAEAFQRAARSTAAGPWSAAAGAYWAARALAAADRPDEARHWLARAAGHGATFYGLLAMAGLGEEPVFDFQVPAVAGVDLDAWLAHPGGERVLLLLEAGRPDAAEEALRRLALGLPADLLVTAAAIAEAAGMPGLALRLGQRAERATGRRLDWALHPRLPWTAAAQDAVEPAFLAALARVESNFDPSARSPAGARGLLQMMPATLRATAAAIGRPDAVQRVGEPSISMTLGAAHLGWLAGHERVNNSLVHLAAAYNAGVGTLARVAGRPGAQDDPLWYLETLPAAETRLFVERVLATYWGYRVRFGLGLADVDQLVAGRWPDFGARPETDRLAERDARN